MEKWPWKINKILIKVEVGDEVLAGGGWVIRSWVGRVDWKRRKRESKWKEKVKKISGKNRIRNFLSLKAVGVSKRTMN